MLFYKRHLYYSNQNRMQQYSPAGTAQGRPLPEITPLTKTARTVSSVNLKVPTEYWMINRGAL